MIVLILGLFMNMARADYVEVGSKNFVEGYVLSEIVARTIEEKAATEVKRNFGLGGTGIVFRALTNKRIDMYVEYSGTIAEVILKRPELKSIDEINEALIPYKLRLSGSLGFSNTYALAVTQKFAADNSVRAISDLARLNGKARFAFSSEFIARQDGLGGLKAKYNLDPGQNLFAMEHALVYGALENDKVDVIEVYSTDAKIKKMNLKLLEDDKSYFPKYEAVIVVRDDLVRRMPRVWDALKTLEGSLTEEKMQELNAMVDIDKKTFAEAAKAFVQSKQSTLETKSDGNTMLSRAKEHFVLVFYSLMAALLIGLPLAVLAREFRVLGQAILIVAALIQTIPALALLCFLIPWFGIGQPLALFALFLYGLLPITLNSYNGLIGIERQYLEISRALGLSYWRRLFVIDLPLASPLILSGIKTSAIISIGTATLAALVGAGGFGAPIVTGLALNDNQIILTGAVPAAAFALVTYAVLSLLEKILIPKGLRI